MTVENVINKDPYQWDTTKRFESPKEPKNHIKGQQQILLRNYFA